VNKTLIMIVYMSLIICGVIAILGAPSPTLERQGGDAITIVWSSLCVAAGCVGTVSAWWRSRVWEVFAALSGAVASFAWTVSLVLQGANAGSLSTASAACMGTALTALLAYRARRLSGNA